MEANSENKPQENVHFIGNFDLSGFSAAMSSFDLIFCCCHRVEDGD